MVLIFGVERNINRGKNMKKIKFNNHFGEMELENKIRSIFDITIAGQIAEDGNYYCIHVDHKTHEKYALTRETEKEAEKMGYWLAEKEETEAVFNGEKVRVMTYEEECAYNEDRLLACVDLWGNIAVDEKFDIDWYMNHCL